MALSQALKLMRDPGIQLRRQPERQSRSAKGRQHAPGEALKTISRRAYRPEIAPTLRKGASPHARGLHARQGDAPHNERRSLRVNRGA
jgi:hypothetical protein